MTENHFTQNDIDESESIIWTDKPHYASQLASIIQGLILTPFGIGIIVLLSVYIKINHTTYALTDKALYQKKGLFSDEIKRVPLERIQNTEYSRSWAEKQFGFGTVQISTAGSGGTELSFNAVPKPDDIQNKINTYVEKYKNTKNNKSTDKVNNSNVAEELKQTRKNLEEIIKIID